MKNFKRSYSTLACMEASIDDVIAYAVRTGMQGVEIRLDREQKICGFGIEEAEDICARFSAAGIAITDLATGVGITGYYEKNMTEAKVCVDLAAAVGAAAIRIFVGGGQKLFTDRVKQDMDGMIKALRELCAYAAEKGVAVWAETHNAYSTAKSVCELIDAVGCDNLKVLWDVIHSIEYGETLAESMAIMGDRLAHIHLKDGVWTGDRNKPHYIHTKLGYGEMPTDELLRLLDAADYDGYISLEWELAWHPELASCYKDTEDTLRGFNSFLDAAAQNVFPPFGDAAWTTFEPECRELAEFSMGKFGESLNIHFASNSFGMAKYVCTGKVEGGKTYALTAACKTTEPENNVYIVLTQMDANGKWLIREHAAEAVRDGDIIRFSDRIQMEEKTASVTVELWLKGKYADVSWYQPHLVPCAPIEKRMVRAAAVHLAPIGRSYEENRDRLLAAVDAAAEQKADIIVLGECMYDRHTTGAYCNRSETEKGTMVTLMRERAKKYNCYIIYNFHENDGGQYYNTSILLGRDGSTVGKYHKTHLTLGEYEGGMTPGDSYPVFDTDFGRIGILICYDHYFSRTAEEVVKNGAEIIFVSTAGDASHKCMARAMDCGVYMVIAGMNKPQTAELPIGPTRIVEPNGEIIAHTDEDLTPVVADIDLNEKKRMFWLSVGPADGEIHGIYRFEKNPDSFKGVNA